MKCTHLAKKFLNIKVWQAGIFSSYCFKNFKIIHCTYTSYLHLHLHYLALTLFISPLIIISVLIYISTKFCISTFDSSHVTIAFMNMQSAVFLDVYYRIVYLI